jgi:hypothetical protein
MLCFTVVGCFVRNLKATAKQKNGKKSRNPSPTAGAGWQRPTTIEDENLPTVNGSMFQRIHAKRGKELHGSLVSFVCSPLVSLLSSRLCLLLCSSMPTIVAFSYHTAVWTDGPGMLEESCTCMASTGWDGLE